MTCGFLSENFILTLLCLWASSMLWYNDKKLWPPNCSKQFQPPANPLKPYPVIIPTKYKINPWNGQSKAHFLTRASLIFDFLCFHRLFSDYSGPFQTFRIGYAGLPSSGRVSAISNNDYENTINIVAFSRVKHGSRGVSREMKSSVLYWSTNGIALLHIRVPIRLWSQHEPLYNSVRWCPSVDCSSHW